MTAEQRQAVLDRDYNRMIALGGNIYFLAKLGATDGFSFQNLASKMTGMPEDEYRAMMMAGGRSPEGNRSQSDGAGRTWQDQRGRRHVARARPSARPSITARPSEPYWQPVFKGYEFVEAMDRRAEAGRRRCSSTTTTPRPSRSK